MTAAFVPGGKASPMWRRPNVFMRALVCVILCAATRRLGKIYFMAGHECYHCRRWVEEGEPHDCWNTTEAALTRHLSDDLREAWERLRETAASFGEQRIYASHHSIMFSRKTCYFFVRPNSQNRVRRNRRLRRSRKRSRKRKGAQQLGGGPRKAGPASKRSREAIGPRS